MGWSHYREGQCKIILAGVNNVISVILTGLHQVMLICPDINWIFIQKKTFFPQGYGHKRCIKVPYLRFGYFTGALFN